LSYCISLWRVFQDWISQTISLGWLRTTILLISASWVAEIAGVSHLCPAWNLFHIGVCIYSGKMYLLCLLPILFSEFIYGKVVKIH
jgi:uncharacterized membrane protein YgdD (TMEM256/DUF423 family)